MDSLLNVCKAVYGRSGNPEYKRYQAVMQIPLGDEASLGLEWGVKSLLWEARVQDNNTIVGLGVHWTVVKLGTNHPLLHFPVGLHGKASWVLFKL